MKKASDNPTTIGWREFVSLPEWGITDLRAKADTGARTSAIDVADIQPLSRGKVTFHVVLSRNHRHHRKKVTATVVRHSTVRSSLGRHEERYVVQTTARIGRIEREIEISLVCRKNLICRMLLGRSALKGLLINPSRTYISTGTAAKR